jgi:hypothetical protein
MGHIFLCALSEASARQFHLWSYRQMRGVVQRVWTCQGRIATLVVGMRKLPNAGNRVRTPDCGFAALRFELRERRDAQLRCAVGNQGNRLFRFAAQHWTLRDRISDSIDRQPRWQLARFHLELDGHVG